MKPSIAFLAAMLYTAAIRDNSGSNEIALEILKLSIEDLKSEDQNTLSIEAILQDFSSREEFDKLPKADILRKIAIHLQEEAEKNTVFDQVVSKISTSCFTNKTISEFWANNPSLLKNLVAKASFLSPELKKKLAEKSDKEEGWSVNLEAGDYLGRNPYILSGNTNNNFYYYDSIIDNLIEYLAEKVSKMRKDVQEKSAPEKYIDKIAEENNPKTPDFNIDFSDFKSHENGYQYSILRQIEQIKGKTTQYFTAKISMDNLDKIRQPRQLGAFQVEEIHITIPFVVFNVVFPLKRKRIKNNLKIEDQKLAAENYLIKIGDVESKLQGSPTKDEETLRELKSIADDINLKISILNNSFISALYPASSINVLVANMASKIYYKDLREEAEMHYSVILKLSDKIRSLMKRFDVDKLEMPNGNLDERDIRKNNFDAIQHLLNLYAENDNKNSDDFLELIKNINFKQSTLNIDINNETSKHIDESQFSDDGQRRLYVLSDESQAAVGMMIDIEQRKILVEKLVQEDRRRINRTTTWITVSILIIISCMILGGFLYGPQFTVGQQELSELNLPLINVPWPVIFWSFLGSFAAMIYRFNRQPIHEFGNVLKWTVTRLVQGVILGSAFYLILVSGISLLSGISTDSAVEIENNRIATEVVLLLTFLVGFSDRFADNIFTALIDKYSIKAESAKTESETHKTI